MTGRGPTVDVVIPFRGSDDQLEALLAMAGRIGLGDGDTLTVVDNRPGAAAAPPAFDGPRRRVIADGRRRSSYYARNRGAEGGTGEWIVFIDADVVAPTDLLERLFETDVQDTVAVLAGGVEDEPPSGSARPGLATRYGHRRAAMSQVNTLRAGPWGYAQTANCAVRRSAFAAVGGFVEVRSGGDADLCFRLRRAGWSIAARDRACVVHRGRATVSAMLAQLARHGSGAAWLNARYPGSFPARRSLGTLAWSGRRLGEAARAVPEDRGFERAAMLALEVASLWAFELGRLLPNRVAWRA